MYSQIALHLDVDRLYRLFSQTASSVRCLDQVCHAGGIKVEETLIHKRPVPEIPDVRAGSVLPFCKRITFKSAIETGTDGLFMCARDVLWIFCRGLLP